MGSSRIEIGLWGKILAGEKAGWHVLIEDDSADSGGFLIFKSRTASLDDCFDSWVQSKAELDRFFDFAGWRVEWSGPEDSQRR